jgi:hypothetical protein
MNYANYDEYSDDRSRIALSGKPFYAASIGILAGAPISNALYQRYGKPAYNDFGKHWATDQTSIFGYKSKIGKAWTKFESATLKSRFGGKAFGKLALSGLQDFVTVGPGMVGSNVSRLLSKAGSATASKSKLFRGKHGYLMPGVGMLFGIMSAEQGIKDEGNLFGAKVGIGSEIGATIGSRAGMFMGRGLGYLAGGMTGSYIGSAVGMLAGGYIGYQVAPTIMNVARAVRRWGSPETGGMFTDNQMTQTMRQRSMLAIRTSQTNMRSELGRESQTLMGALY